MITTIPQAVEFILESVQNITPNEVYTDLDRKLILEELLTEVVDKVNDKLTDDDHKVILGMWDNLELIESYIKTKVSNYNEILQDAVEEILTSFILWDEE